jgi:hypothetical protein
MRSFWSGALASAVLVLGSTPVFAQGDMEFAGTVQLGWTDYLLPGVVAHPNAWLAKGSAVFTVTNPGLNIQINAADDADRIPSRGLKDFGSYGGDVYWRDYAGSFGINANASTATDLAALSNKAAPAPYSYSVQTYGLFGQWFAEPYLTLEMKGGRFEGKIEGLYGDGAVVLYPYHDMALSLTADYADAEHLRKDVRDLVFTVEYLPVHDVPVSLYIGYDFAYANQLPHQQVSVLLVGIKAYIGGEGRTGSLVDYHRNGTTDWDAAPSTVFELGF